MIPIRCWSCGKPIGHLWEEYKQRVEKGESGLNIISLIFILMKLDFSISGTGISLSTQKGKFRIKYPHDIWKSFPGKEFLAENIAYLNTICTPLVSGAKELRYNTPMPIFKKDFDVSVLKDIPSIAEDGRQSTQKLLSQFKKAKYIFQKYTPKKPVFSAKTGERAVVPFSCGKDSLLTLAVCSEIGLRPVPVYVNDTVSPRENKLKLRLIKKIAKKNKLSFGIVENSIEKLNDFEFWGKGETDKGYSHLVMSFGFIVIPFLKRYKAKYLVYGNEHDLNSSFVNKDGVRSYSSYDQSFEGTKRIGRLISMATLGKSTATSIISPLYDLAIMKVLHYRYPNLGKCQSSCPGLDAVRQKRWCYKCADDVRFAIYMLAIGKSPKDIGIRKNMMAKKYIKYHTIFNKKEKGRYEKAEGDEQLKFAYYLALKNGAKGYAIDLFKKKFLKEIKPKEGRLYKKYFSIHDASLIPKKIRKMVVSVYKEELGTI
jgi:hypothetical protein